MPEERSTGPGKRLSLTRTQLQTAAGAALLKICQAVTEGGTLSAEGLANLKSWLGEHAHSALPAIEYLTRALGPPNAPPTPDRLREIYSDIEAILPPEVRAE